MGWSLGFSTKRIAPTPFSEASNSTVKGLDGSGCLRMGAVVKAVFNLTMACLAAGFLGQGLGNDSKPPDKMSIKVHKALKSL